MPRTFLRRKVTPKVKDGVVQKKHRHQPTAALGYVLDRQSAARGCRHILSKKDIREFTAIIPNWPDLALGLESIVLTRAGSDHDGLYRIFHGERTGSIEIPAWDGDLWQVFTPEHYEEHREFFERLGLATERTEDGVECRFTMGQARAFLLLHVFLHELGHHVDRMESKARNSTRRGDQFAEAFANRLSAEIWPQYIRIFGNPRRGARRDRKQ
jgi:hypothetical protein